MEQGSTMVTSRHGTRVAIAVGAALLLTSCVPLPPSLDASSAPAATPPATTEPADPVEPSTEPSAEPAEPAEPSESPEPGADAERGVQGRASVDIPAGWEETQGDATFTLRYEQPESATHEAIGIADDFGRFQGARAGASIFIAQAQLQLEGFCIVSQEDIDVPGASSGVRVDFTFGPDGETSDGMWLVAVDNSDGHSIAVAYSGGEREVDDAELDAIVASVELLPAD